MLVFKNTDSSFDVFFLCSHVHSVISASVINIVPFIEAFDRLRNVLFISLLDYRIFRQFVGNLVLLVIYIQIRLSTDCALHSDRARSFNQPKRTIYRNFIITKVRWFQNVST